MDRLKRMNELRELIFTSAEELRTLSKESFEQGLPGPITDELVAAGAGMNLARAVLDDDDEDEDEDDEDD